MGLQARATAATEQSWPTIHQKCDARGLMQKASHTLGEMPRKRQPKPHGLHSADTTPDGSMARISFHKGPVLTTRAYPVHWRSTGLILKTDAASASLEARKAFPWETFCQGLLLLVLRKAKMPRVLRLAAMLVPFCPSTIKAREPAMRMCVLPRLKGSRDTQARSGGTRPVAASFTVGRISPGCCYRRLVPEAQTSGFDNP